jgi:hypothetical protein
MIVLEMLWFTRLIKNEHNQGNAANKSDRNIPIFLMLPKNVFNFFLQGMVGETLNLRIKDLFKHICVMKSWYMKWKNQMQY